MPGADALGGVSPEMEAAKYGIGFGISAFKTGLGLINAAKAKKEAALLEKTRPVRPINPEAIDEKALAESELQQGMSAEAKRAYEEGTDRDLGSSIDAILKGGGSVNSIADIFDESNVGRQRLAIAKDNLRLNQINNVVRSYANMQDERDKNFEYNQVAPWMDKAQANAEARRNASNMIWNGVESAGSAGMNAFNDYSNTKALNSYFGMSGGGANSTMPLNIPSNIPITPSFDYSSQMINPTLNRTPSLQLPMTAPNRNFIPLPQPYNG